MSNLLHTDSKLCVMTDSTQSGFLYLGALQGLQCGFLCLIPTVISDEVITITYLELLPIQCVKQ